MKYEHSSEPLLPLNKFLRRMARQVGLMILWIIPSLAVGMAGYRITENMSWLDAFYNASMILSGMGPASDMTTEDGKLFAGFYALYSGLFVIATMGILLAPVFHRVLHKFHMKRK